MWKGHQVVFELLSPLHVGNRKIGNVLETRPYVPGRAVWGALTSRITRDQGHQQYESVGALVQEELAWTYFFPSTNQHSVRLWPWCDPREFQWLFLDGFASTALEDGHTAEEGALHEVEYIAPRTRSGQRVYLLGYLFERDGSQLRWRNALERIQVGGERSYGWGRVRPIRVEACSGSCFGYATNNDTERPEVEVPANRPLPAHVLASDEGGYEGSVEPLVGRETDTHTAAFGILPSPALVCWAPGTETLQKRSFRISSWGLWVPT